MMVLHPTSSTTETRSPPPSTSTLAMQQKSTLRRKRSKGTIVAYGNEMNPSVSGSGGGGTEGGSEFGGSSADQAASSASIMISAAPSSMSVSSSLSQSQQQMLVSQQHSASKDASSVASGAAGPSAASSNAKPCHSARLALLCAQNALRMGARTQLLLCPPGKARKTLQSALRQRVRMTHSNNHHHSSSIGSTSRQSLSSQDSSIFGGGYFGLDKLLGGPDGLAQYDALEEDLLLRTPSAASAAAAASYEDDEDETHNSAQWASSGDEDGLTDLDELLADEPVSSHDDEKRYLTLREPLFVAAAAESASTGRAAMISMAAGGSGKEQLPFNRRKIRFFDCITSSDAATARAYLRTELHRSKKRYALLLTRNLRKVQADERRKRRLLLERGEQSSASVDESMMTELTDTNPDDATLFNGVQPFPAEMTPAAAAALILESLALNPVESVEGMSKCYDGIVAAGVALLDAQAPEPTTLSPKPTTEGGGNNKPPRPRRSEILAALAPLLITSLEQPAGEVVLALAKLRRLCGTPRYQRRFVQRVAPALIRPPRAAMWCLRHQNDMEAIVAAAELIFDAAFDLFGKGWYERGRLLLMDTKRAATLHSAAQQLRLLSSASPSDGLVALGLSAPHGNRRRLLATGPRKAGDGTGGGGGGGSNAVLAEWEVIAVDRQIRISISNVLNMDWSRIAIHADIPKPHNRRATVTTGATKHHRISTLPQVSSTEMSPKAGISPRGGGGTAAAGGHKSFMSGKTPQSPPHAAIPLIAPPEGAENVAHTHHLGFSTIPVHANIVPSERALSPPPPSSMPNSPPALQRSNSKDADTKTPMTPPRSPKSPTRALVPDAVLRSTEPIPILAPLSPRRGRSLSRDAGVVPAPISTPLSPSASSIGTSGSGDLVTYRPSIVNSHAGSSTTAHYRMLTSTAAERKRTVAACRALRAQIQRFEDAFIQLHGRPPKGAADRAPLATTYAQYREWKRAIRADAACRIQALFRGAYLRWRLLRLNDPRVTQVIVARAGRAKSAEAVMNQISIPVEIGQADHNRSPSVSMASTSGSDSYSGSATDRFAPPWAAKIARRRPADRESLPAPPRYTPVAQSPPSLSDMGSLPIAELQARKRDLKAQLKQYDMNFARRHGRMPVKAEKEPIRHLYESYNTLKSQISQMEHEGRQSTAAIAPTAAGTGSNVAAPLSPVASQVLPQVPLQQRVSPTSGSESGTSGGEESPLRINQQARGNQLRLPRTASPPLASGSTSSSPAPAPDLSALKAEKVQLHQMLRAYEKDFFREHRRQVSSFADIQPVASQYRRYKEIKKAIAALQQAG